MPLIVSNVKKFKGVILRSGRFYSFLYRRWENDPQPLVLFLNAIDGINPSTGNRWSLIQALNFSYIPAKTRTIFLKEWTRLFTLYGGNIQMTWRMVKTTYPYLERAIRRYLTYPPMEITFLREVDFNKIEAEVKTIWTKDFSQQKTLSTQARHFLVKKVWDSKRAKAAEKRRKRGDWKRQRNT